MKDLYRSSMNSTEIVNRRGGPRLRSVNPATLSTEFQVHLLRSRHCIRDSRFESGTQIL